MGRHPLLESFDIPAASAEPPGPTEDWLAGHAAGRAEAEQHFAARQDALSEEVVQSIADLAFSRAEARAHVIAALEPLFRTLVAQVLPALSRTDFAPQVLWLLTEASKVDTMRPVRVALHPDQCAALAPLMDKLPTDAVTLIADTALTLHEARIATPEDETVVDADRLLEGATRALSAILEPSLSRRYHD